MTVMRKFSKKIIKNKNMVKIENKVTIIESNSRHINIFTKLEVILLFMCFLKNNIVSRNIIHY